MKIKLDENLGQLSASYLEKLDFDASTVFEQGLSGKSDETVLHVASGERRILITMDTDFCNILRFPPENYCGIIVIKLGTSFSYSLLNKTLSLIALNLKTHAPRNFLWIAEPTRIKQLLRS